MAKHPCYCYEWAISLLLVVNLRCWFFLLETGCFLCSEISCNKTRPSNPRFLTSWELPITWLYEEIWRQLMAVTSTKPWRWFRGRAGDHMRRLSCLFLSIIERERAKNINQTSNYDWLTWCDVSMKYYTSHHLSIRKSIVNVLIRWIIRLSIRRLS